jgi:hypothetical protein
MKFKAYIASGTQRLRYMHARMIETAGDSPPYEAYADGMCYLYEHDHEGVPVYVPAEWLESEELEEGVSN